MNVRISSRLARTTLAAVALGAALAGCAPLLVGGAFVGGGLVATDRRTTGIQLEDEGIERRAGNAVRELATLGHVNITSYNRLVLITGEVPGEREKAAVEAAVAKVENVKSVVNELGIGPNSSTGSRTTDTFITSKVKATMVDAKAGKSSNIVALGLIGGSPRFEDCAALSADGKGAEQTSRLEQFFDSFETHFEGSVCAAGYDAFFDDALKKVAEGCMNFIP